MSRVILFALVVALTIAYSHQQEGEGGGRGPPQRCNPQSEVADRCVRCEPTCQRQIPPRPCRERCRRGCKCRSNWIRARRGGRCIRRNRCPARGQDE